MISIAIDTSDLDAKLRSLSTPQMVQDIAGVVADAVVAEGAKYSAQSGRKRAFVSARQRRFFFAALRRGAITVPYQRTGHLGGSSVKQPFGGGVDVVWTAPYSEIVIGEKQDPYFDNWKSVTAIAAKLESDTAELIATAEVIKVLTKAGLA